MEKHIILPSVVGVGETDLGMLSLGNLGTRKSEQPSSVAWNGSTYLVGANVAQYARPVERMDFLRLVEGPEIRALTYTALGKLLGPGAHTVHLMAGLPVEVMGDRDAAQTTLKGMRNWLVGEHAFVLDGASYVLKIQEKAHLQVMAQPAGSFFAWGLDDRGVWRRPQDDLQAQVAVCDIGFNTLDLFTVQGGNIVGRFTGGETVGMRRGAELLAQAVLNTHQVKLSLHEADHLLRQRQPMLHIAKGRVDLSPVVTQALDVTAGAIVAFLESRWGNGKQFAYLLFTGGGAEMLKERLFAQYPHGVMLSQSVLANALGLARYGRRVFKDASHVIGLDPGFGGIKAVCL